MTDQQRDIYVIAYTAIRARGEHLQELYNKCFDGVNGQNDFAFESFKKLIEQNERAKSYFFEKASGK